MVIDGKIVAGQIIEKLKKLVTPKKSLDAVLVGNNPNSISFIKQKRNAAKELGVAFKVHKFPAAINQKELEDEVGVIVSDESVGGVLIQLPLPEKFNRERVLNVIPKEKDVDVLGEQADSEFKKGASKVVPPAAATVKEIMEFLSLDVRNQKVAVIGAGILVGRPISIWLKGKAKEVAVFIKETQNMNSKLKDFDVIVSGAGKGYLFGASDLKENAIVIDFGYDKREGKFVGDFDNRKTPESLKYTPTPGGTGPILVAELYENFFTLTENSK